MKSSPIAVVSFKMIFVLAFAICLGSCNDGHNQLNTIGDASLSTILENSYEVNSRLLVTNDNSVIVSANKNDFYEFFEVKNNQFNLVQSIPSKDLFNPFFLNYQLCGLSDSVGNELYKSTVLNPPRSFKIGKTIEYAKSFWNSQYAVIKYSKDKYLYLFDSKRQTVTQITAVEKRNHGIYAGERYQGLILNIDDALHYYDIQKRSTNIIGHDLIGKNRTPFYYNDTIYFSSNANSEFFNIYRTHLDKKKSELVLQANYDLTLPKLNTYLYYVQCERNEYKLVRTDFTKTEVITTQGVVYDYELLTQDKIAIIYSDIITPRTLVFYDEITEKLEFIPGSQNQLGLRCTYLESTTFRSPAYIFIPDSSKAVKGVILNFHAGLHSDFSPRWDNILIAMAYSGYIMVSPNYPMSSGYGKTYNNKSIRDAVKDMNSWKNYLDIEYSGLPLYFLSSSSGNILREECLESDSKSVIKAISLFGLSNRHSYKSTIPIFYVFGNNDPKINHVRRTYILENFRSNSTIVSYDNEGHWLRRKENVKDVIKKILVFLKS